MQNLEQQLRSRIEEMFTPEQIEQMQDMTHRMSIAIGVLHCGTTDKDVLCNQIHSDKLGMIPLELIRAVYDEKIPDMMGDELIVDAQDKVLVHPDILPAVLDYERMLESQSELSILRMLESQ